jgi:guanine deaminase
MTIFRGHAVDTPSSPFTSSTNGIRSEADAGIRVVDGVITARGAFADVRHEHGDDDVVDLSGGLLMPGLVDTHVHYPQVRVIGALGMPLLEWLDQCALPEETRLADVTYARAVATEFVDGLAHAGTTTALVFGSHFASAVDELFLAAARRGLRVTSGLVVADTVLRDELLTDPERAYTEGLALAERWHGVGRARYAVTPRFSLSSTHDLLHSCGALLKDVEGSWFTSHVNENGAEIATVNESHGCDYLESYDRHALVGRQSVLAHNVHPTDRELDLLAARDASIAHCPTSNAALASGLFPLRRHVERGVRVALGTDVGAGTGFSLFKEGLQAYFMQQLHPQGLPLTAAHLLHLATAAGADALGLGDQVGDLSIGKRFDAVWVRPAEGTTLDVALRYAASPDDAVAKTFALASTSDVAGVWVDGDSVH